MTESTEERSARRDRVLDIGALRALAHPLRVRILDMLSQYGPQTASTLASSLGESSGSTSYHLRALAKHQLIREVEDRGTARERWWERPIGGLELNNPEAMKTPAGRAVSQMVTSEFLRNRHEQLVEFSERRLGDESSEWFDSVLISTANTRMTVEQTQELSSSIQALLDAAVEKYRGQEGDGVRPVTIRADVFPLPGLGEER